MKYKLEDDPNIACVLRVVSADRYAQAKEKVARMNVRKLFTMPSTDYCLGETWACTRQGYDSRVAAARGKVGD